MFETMTSAFMDEFPRYLKGRKVLLTAVVCFVEFLLGIPCIMNGGIYFLTIMDWYSSVFSLMVISFTECVVIAWVYGLDRFYKDISLMIGYEPCLWWKAAWGFITPATILFVLAFTIIIHTPVTYGDYIYPNWAIGIGWVFALCSLVPLPVCAVIRILKAEGTLLERIKSQIRPADDFGPALDIHRELYKASLAGTDANIEVTEMLTGNAQPEKC